MRTPIISVDGFDIVFFETLTEAERKIEPEDVMDFSVELFDADGCLLKTEVEVESTIGIGPVSLKKRSVRIVGSSGEKCHIERLRQALVGFLVSVSEDPRDALIDESLEALVLRASRVLSKANRS